LPDLIPELAVTRVLLTGGRGFIGNNVLPRLEARYSVAAPTRAELDLLDAGAVRKYLARERFDAVVHLANPTARNPVDKREELFERSLRVFASLDACGDLYGRMIYVGSGAEYGKHRAIASVTEDALGQELPRDAYGLSRYLMNEIAAQRDNLFNLRVFGCYGAGDPPYNLIPHIVACIKENRAIELRQDMRFDFLHVMDIVPVLTHFIENKPEHKAYNLCSGIPVRIGEIAEEVKRRMNSDLPVVFRQDGLGLEYTGDNARLRAELANWKPRTMRDGIRETLESENRKT
jgi:GDP-L-fucose synthase